MTWYFQSAEQNMFWPGKNSFKMKVNQKVLIETQKLREFPTIRLALKEILKGVI